MTMILLAGLPLLLAAGCLSWMFTMGAREQARSDAFAEAWVRDNPAHTPHKH
jgi:hypothetical protein